MAKRTVPYEDILYQDLQDPEEAAAYLNAALEDDSENAPEVFLLALRDVAKARGIRQIAHDTQLSRESLYRTLSRRGNPRFSTLEAVLESVGLKLTVEVKAPETKAA
jgi:probable addiction module antidote protein